MSFPNPFRPRARGAARTDCPFCPGLSATVGALCNLCRRDALLRGVKA